MMKRTLLLCALFLTSQACFGAGSSEVFAQIQGTRKIVGTQFSEDGKRLFTLDEGASQIKVWDSASGRQITTIRLDRPLPMSPFAPIRLSNDGKWLSYMDIQPGRSGISVHVQSLEDSNLQRDFDQAMSVAIAPGSTRLYVSYAGRIEVLGLPDFKLISTITTERAKRGFVMRVSADGSLLALGGLDNVSVFDTSSGAELLSRDIGGTSLAMVFSPDKRYLATGCEKRAFSFSGCDASVYLVDLSGSGRDIKLGDGKRVISALGFGADSRSVLSAARETGEVIQQGLPDGKPLNSWTIDARVPYDMVADLAVSSLGVVALPAGNQLRLISLAGGGVAPVQQAIMNREGVRSGIDDQPKQLGVSRNGLAMALYGGGRMLSAASSLVVWDLEKGRRLFAYAYSNGQSLTQAALSPDGRWLYVERTAGDYGFEVWNTASKKLERTIRITKAQFGQNRLIVSPDGKLLAACGNDGRVSIWSAETGQLVDEFQAFKDSIMAPGANSVADLVFSADGQRLLVRALQIGLRLFDLSRPGHPLLWQLEKGQFDLDRIVSAALSPDGRLLAYSVNSTAIPQKHTVSLIQVSDGQSLTTILNDPKDLAPYTSALLFSPDGRQLILGGSDGKLARFDLATRQLGPRRPAHQGEINSLAWKDSPATLVSSSADGAISAWRGDAEKPVATMLKRGKDWLVLTDAGYFNASSTEAAEQVNVVRDDKVYSMNAFWDVFQRPDIVGARLRGEDVSSLSGTLSIDYALRNPPPAVRITEAPGRSDQARVRVRYQIDDQGGGIAEVRVFQNGKLVRSDGVFRDAGSRTLMPVAAPSDKAVAAAARQLGGRGANQAASLQPREVAVKNCNPCSGELEVELLPGEKNEIHVIAFNRDNTIQSVAGQATIESSAPRRTPKLWLLAVGLNKFQNVPGLVNARKDAIDFACKYLGGEAFRSHAHGQSCAESGRAGSLYGEREIELVDLLLDQDAGRDRILAGLAQVAERAMPGDTFVWFVASHGLLDGNGLFGIVPFDARCLDANCERVSQLITSNDILKASAAIRAMRQVMILDTCYSGGLDTKLSGLYDARITMLARNMGLHLMASAAATEVAQDGDPGSNGLFTGQLLAALADARADSNGDHRISVVELGNYAKQQTEQLSLARGQAQTPLIQHFGEDLPLVRLQ